MIYFQSMLVQEIRQTGKVVIGGLESNGPVVGKELIHLGFRTLLLFEKFFCMIFHVVVLGGIAELHLLFVRTVDFHNHRSSFDRTRHGCSWFGGIVKLGRLCPVWSMHMKSRYR